MNIALLTAAGSGTRMGQDIPKQFMNIDDCPVIIYTMQAFQNHPQIDAIAVVCLEGWEMVLKAYASQYGITKLKWIFPGCSPALALTLTKHRFTNSGAFSQPCFQYIKIDWFSTTSCGGITFSHSMDI